MSTTSPHWTGSSSGRPPRGAPSAWRPAPARIRRRWAPHLDFACWDNYPPDDTSQARMAMTHDLMRGLKDGAPFWLMEQTPSYTASREVNPLKRPGVMRLWSWQAVAHGADAVLFFQLRASRGACEKDHGAVIGHAGRSDTRVFREVAELGAELDRLGGAVLGARTPARVALLFDWDSWWALEMSSATGLVRYQQVVLSYHRALWDAGVDVDVVAVTADLSAYDVVVAPALHMVKGDLPRRLEEVATRGGSVVATFLSGRVDENDQAFLADLPGPLGHLMGIRIDEWDTRWPESVNPVRLAQWVEVESRLIFEIVIPQGAEVIGTYQADFYAGTPAVTRNAFGAGAGWYVAAGLDQPGVSWVIRQVLERHGLIGPYPHVPDLETAVRGRTGKCGVGWSQVPERAACEFRSQATVDSGKRGFAQQLFSEGGGSMSALVEALVPRRLTSVVTDLLADEPVVVLQGPRSVGKSTLLRHLATMREREVIDLDEPATRDAVRADPSLFAAADAPVFVDEYQHAPELLDAIKAELNRSLTPGRFVLTGTTSYASLPQAAQSLTGRLHIVPVWPLSQGEIAGNHETFAATAVADPAAVVGREQSTTTRAEYIHRAVSGGFPVALRRATPEARARWFDDYVTSVLERDVLDLSRVRQRAVLPRLLRRLAGQTGQLLNIAKAAEELSVDPSTAEDYTRLLEAVFLINRLPAWGPTVGRRVTARSKIHVVDSGVAARLLRLTETKLARLQPAALTELGHLLETFCVGELRKQLSWLTEPVEMGHWRTHDGSEVDFVAERMDGGVVGFELKSETRVPGRAFHGLQQLRSKLGTAFLGGIVLYTGQRSYTFDDRLHVAPIDRLWTTSHSQPRP